LELVEKHRLSDASKAEEHDATVIALTTVLGDHQVDQFDLCLSAGEFRRTDSCTGPEWVEEWVHGATLAKSLAI